MRTRMVPVLILILSMLIPHTLTSQAGCMDNSKHLDTWDGCDYKAYHYVYCTCPCFKYPRSNIKGRCVQCDHFRDYSLGQINYYEYDMDTGIKDKPSICSPDDKA